MKKIALLIIFTMCFTFIGGITPAIVNASTVSTETVYLDNGNSFVLKNAKVSIEVSKNNLELLSWKDILSNRDYASQIAVEPMNKNILYLSGASGNYPALSNGNANYQWNGTDELTVTFTSNHPDFTFLNIEIVYHLSSEVDYYSRSITFTDTRTQGDRVDVNVVDNKINNIIGTGEKYFYGLSTSNEIKYDSVQLSTKSNKTLATSYLERNIFGVLSQQSDYELSVPSFVIRDGDNNGFYVMSDADYGMGFDFIQEETAERYGVRHTKLPMHPGVCTSRKIVLIDGLMVDYKKQMEISTNYIHILDDVSPLPYKIKKQDEPITCIYAANTPYLLEDLGGDISKSPLPLLDTDTVINNWDWPGFGAYYVNQTEWPSYLGDEDPTHTPVTMTLTKRNQLTNLLHNAGYNVGSYNNGREASQVYVADRKLGTPTPARPIEQYYPDGDITGPIGWENNCILDPRSEFTNNMYQVEHNMFSEYGYDATFYDRNDHRTVKQGVASIFPELQEVESGWLANIYALKYKKTLHEQNGYGEKTVFANVVPYTGAYALTRYSDAVSNETLYENISLFKLQSLMPQYRYTQCGHYGILTDNRSVFRPFFAGGIPLHYTEYQGFGGGTDTGLYRLTMERAEKWQQVLSKNNLGDGLRFVSNRIKKVSYDDSEVYSDNPNIPVNEFLYEDGTKLIVAYNNTKNPLNTIVTTPDGKFSFELEPDGADYKMIAAIQPIIIDNCTSSQFEVTGGFVTSSNSGNANLDNEVVIPAGSNNLAKWKPVIAKAGEYEVFARWTQGTDRATTAAYVIKSQQGDITKTVDQTKDGNNYISLGKYNFDVGNAEISLLQNSLGSVSADAIKLKYTDIGSTQSYGTVLTNPQITGQSSLISDGAYSNQALKGQYYSVSGGKAVYNVQVPVTGAYEVYVRAPQHPTATKNKLVSIDSENGTTAVKMDNTRFGGQWMLAGTYKFNQSKSADISLSSMDSQPFTTDAIMLVPTGLAEVGEPGASAVFVGTDNETKGNWQNIYGSAGYAIPGVGESFTSDVSVSLVATENVVNGNSTDADSVQNPKIDGSRIESAYTSPDSVYLNIMSNNSKTAQMALYFADGRNDIEITDAYSGNIIDSREINASTSSIYVKYNINGKVRIKITALDGMNTSVTAVFAGIVKNIVATSLTDTYYPLNNWNELYSHSSGLIFDSNNASFVGNDSSRITRSETSNQNFVLKHSSDEDITSFKVKAYGYGGAAKVKFYTSADNTLWEPVLSNNTEPVEFNAGGNWFGVDFTPASVIPVGTKYLKVELCSQIISWDTQVSEVYLGKNTVSVTTEKYTSLNLSGIPMAVNALCDDGSSFSIPISWNNGSPLYNASLIGAYSFIGSPVIPADCINGFQTNLNASIYVIDTINKFTGTDDFIYKNAQEQGEYSDGTLLPADVSQMGDGSSVKIQTKFIEMSNAFVHNGPGWKTKTDSVGTRFAHIQRNDQNDAYIKYAVNGGNSLEVEFFSISGSSDPKSAINIYTSINDVEYTLADYTIEDLNLKSNNNYYAVYNAHISKLPDGIRYAKIVMSNGSASLPYWAPQITKVTSVSAPELTDNLQSFDKLDSKTNGWQLETSLGVSSFKKTNNQPQSITYYVQNISDFNVDLFCVPDGVSQDDLNVSVSPDGINWSNIAIKKGTQTSIGNWAWMKNRISSASAIPNGMNYIRIEVPILLSKDGVTPLPDTEGWRELLYNVQIFAKKPSYDISVNALKTGNILSISGKTTKNIVNNQESSAIIAVLSGNKLIKIFSEPLDFNFSNIQSNNNTVDITGLIENITVKAFLWNSLFSTKPLTHYIESVVPIN